MRLLVALAAVHAVLGLDVACAEDSCEDLVVLRGPGALLSYVSEKLGDVNIPTTFEATGECRQLEADLFGDEIEVRVVLEEPDGHATTRVFREISACVTWIESRYVGVRTPLTIASARPLAVSAAPSATTEIAEAPYKAPMPPLYMRSTSPIWNLNFGVETSFDDLGAQWYGLRWSACQRVGSVCLGLGVRSSLRAHRSMEFTEFFGTSIDAVGMGEVPVEIGFVRITSRASVGVVRNSWHASTPLLAIDCTEIDCKKTNYGLLGEAGGDLAISIAEGVALHLGATVSRQTLYGSTDILLPTKAVRIAIGIRGTSR